MPLATSLINSFSQTVTVTRYAAGHTDLANHVQVAGASSTFTCRMSVQPLNGKELFNLPEAQRTRNLMKGYTSTELFTVQNSDAKAADCVTLNGIEYEVHAVEPWEGDLSHWKVLLKQKGE